MGKTIKELLEIHNGEGNKTQGETWQALRRAVLERDSYICRKCGDKANTVHHKEYGRIAGDALVSVCQKCHIRQHGLDPTLTSRSTWEMHDLQTAITGLERKLTDTKGELDGIIKGYIVPQLPPFSYYQYGTNVKHLAKDWRRHYIAHLKRRLKEMKASSKELRKAYSQAKLERVKQDQRVSELSFSHQ